jgi:hypothetical protein
VWTGSSISTLTVSCLVLCFDLPDFHHATQKWFFSPRCANTRVSLSLGRMRWARAWRDS